MKRDREKRDRENRDLRNRDRVREHERDGQNRDADRRKRLRDEEHKLRENKYRERDTSHGRNSSLYQNPREAGGFRAGRDQREHKKLAAEHKKRDDLHWSEKKPEEMNERDWRFFLEDYDISFQGSKIPRPLRGWADSKLNAEFLKALRRACYLQPTPIQRAAIPPALEQRDVMGIAKRFSGKTAAYVLPMLTHISRLPRISEVNEAEGPYAVVMAPTSKLAQQIEDETIQLAHYLGIKVVSIVGGESIEEQGSGGVGRGCELVIATPSRLLDCLERRYVVLNQCNCVVLDAADCMIDMGFEPQIVGVLEAMPDSNPKPENEDAELDGKKIYSTYIFSSTMPPALEQLAKKYLRNPVVVIVRNPVFTAGPRTNCITMNVVMVKESKKGYRLRRLLDELGDKTAMVFVNTKENADTVAKSLDKAGYRVTTVPGGKSQEQREESRDDKRCKVLVSTDFGQGVDVPDVDYVINYDMPGNIEAYVHRIERTFPAGKFGVATTFLTLSDCDVFYAVKRMLREHGNAVPPKLDRHEASKIIPDRPVRWKDTVSAH